MPYSQCPIPNPSASLRPIPNSQCPIPNPSASLRPMPCAGQCPIPPLRSAQCPARANAQSLRFAPPNSQLPILNYQLPITNYQLPITNYPLPDIPHLYEKGYISGASLRDCLSNLGIFNGDAPYGYYCITIYNWCYLKV